MGTRAHLKSNKGLTLVEVLISIGLIGVLLVATTSTIISSQFLSAYSKHKSQAIGVAQRILEEQRRTSFPTIVSQPAAPVTLDTRGTYASTVDDFMGSRTITVKQLDTYRKQVQVAITWTERFASKPLMMQEVYGTNIANEPQLN